MRRLLVWGAAGALLLTPTLSSAESQRAAVGVSKVKILVKKDGWYRVSTAALSAQGFTFPADPETLRLSTTPDPTSAPVPFQVHNGNVEFYGRALNLATTNVRTYWLTTSASGSASHMSIVKARTDPASPSGSFTAAVARPDRVNILPENYISRVLNGNDNDNNWFGKSVNGLGTRNQQLTATNVASGIGTLDVVIQGYTNGDDGSQSSHTINVSLNGTALVGAMTGNGRVVMSQTYPVSNIVNGVNNVDLSNPGPGTASVEQTFVISVTLHYQHSFTADSNALTLPVTALTAISIGGFTDSHVHVIDISNPAQPRELATEVRGAGPYTTSFNPPLGTTNVYAFADPVAITNAPVVADAPSNLHSTSNGADLIVISHANFLSAAQTLADYRQNTDPAQYRVKTVDVQDVYDEFSDGNKTLDGITAFLQYAQLNWDAPAPKYVLLVGDATYDQRNYLSAFGLGDYDFIPTTFRDTQFTTVPSDDSLADFNSDSVPEMAVGRLPARTLAEAQSMVQKIIDYETGPVRSPRDAVLVSDATIGYDFKTFSDDYQNTLTAHSVLLANITRRNRPDPPTAGDDATFHNTLIADANAGPTIVNYFGHGSSTDWTNAANYAPGGKVFRNDDPPGLTNTHLSLYMMMTCLSGYFVEPVRPPGIAEALMLSAHGAVATWSSTGETIPADQVTADKTATGEILDGLTLGQAMLDAKSLITDVDVRHSWSLLGDPTTVLR